MFIRLPYKYWDNDKIPHYRELFSFFLKQLLAMNMQCKFFSHFVWMKWIKSIILESNLGIILHGLKILDLYPFIESRTSGS